MSNKRKEFSNSKIGLFSDIHIGLGQNSSIWHQNILDFAEWTSSFYSKNNIEEIIIPGDIFHNRTEINVNTLSVAKKFFDYFKKFKLFISTGNHDCYYKDSSSVNSISLLKEWNNITIVDSNVEIFFNKESNKNISLVPWGTKTEDIPKTDICIGHFEIASFKMNAYAVCNEGLESHCLLDKAPFVVSGHFHHREHRTYKNGEILYLGSPYQQNFGDSGSERGIYILDLKTNNFEFIKNNVSPVHYKISLQDILNKKITSKHLKELIPQNMISFVIDCSCSSNQISLISSKLQNLNPKFFRMDYPYLENSIVSGNEESSFNTLDIPKNITDFVNALEVEHKEDIICYLNDLYNKLAV